MGNYTDFLKKNLNLFMAISIGLIILSLVLLFMEYNKKSSTNQPTKIFSATNMAYLMLGIIGIIFLMILFYIKFKKID